MDVCATIEGMPVWILMLLGVMLAGCASKTPAAPTGPLDVQVVFGVGETVEVPGAAIRLRFQRVMGDSRCPADAFCIQLGDAVVRIDVLSGVRQATYDLHTGNRPVMHGDLTIALVQLDPYPFSNHPIGPGEYRATLRITR
jgi:hypothetical protein